MISPSKTTMTTDGRTKVRPIQFDELTSDEQMYYCIGKSDVDCDDCRGEGGFIHSESMDCGYYMATEEYFEPCDCVVNNPESSI